VADRSVGLRDVLVLAAACVAVVLGAAVLTSFLPADAQGVVFRTPLLIVVLIAGTAVALWRIARPRREASSVANGGDDQGAEPQDRPTAE
jgi:FtsH-binding integral membrane protein